MCIYITEGNWKGGIEFCYAQLDEEPVFCDGRFDCFGERDRWEEEEERVPWTCSSWGSKWFAQA